MVEFGGWEMPVQYTGIIDEHRAVRERAGIFDVSHMGEFWVDGPDALAFLQHVTTADVAQLAVGQAGYGLLCRPDGGVVDDLFIYHIDHHTYLLVVNASNIDKDWQWLSAHAHPFEMILTNQSDTTALIALQGPDAERILQTLVGDIAQTLPFHGVTSVRHANHDLIVARTGYTGEDGFEVIVPNDLAESLWRTITAAGIEPAGLGARDTLRLEAGMNLYGQDMGRGTRPWDAGLAWTVALAKGRDFMGKAALEAAARPHAFLGLVLKDRGGVLRAHQRVTTSRGEGEITSGTFSPTLGVPIALARLPAGTQPGEAVSVAVRDRALAALVVKPPFVRAGKALVNP